MPERRQPKPVPAEYLQTTFLAPDEATVLADYLRLHVLIRELTARYIQQPTTLEGDPITIHVPRDVANLLMPEMKERGLGFA